MPVINPKTVTEADLSTTDDTQIEDAVASRLAALDDDGTPDPEITAAASTVPDVPPTPVAPKPAAVTQGDEPTPQPADTTAEIPAAYIRSAIHQGMSEQDVKDMYDADPAQAEKFFSKVHDSTNRITEEYARLGRQTQPQIPAAEPVQKKVDLAELKKQYGEDDPLVKVIASLTEMIPSTPVQPQPQQQYHPYQPSLPQDTAKEVLRQQVTNFFVDPTLKTYHDVYGNAKDPKDLTIKQQENRWAVIELADQIMAGATSQGRSLSVADALDRAHLVVSEPFRASAVRKEIEQKIVKRGNGLTLKPQAGAKDAGDSKKSLEEKTAERLAALKF